MRKSRFFCGFVLALAIVAGGCGTESEPVAGDEGTNAQVALASTDVKTTHCKGTSDSYSRGEPRPTARMRRSASPIILEPNTRPQQFKRLDNEPWVTKAPIAVRTGTKPVDVAVMDAGGAKVGLAYDDWSAQKSPDAAYQRIRFAPCEGDATKPTWFGWPGAIVADRENVCLELAVREESGDVSLERVSLGSGCPGETD